MLKFILLGTLIAALVVFGPLVYEKIKLKIKLHKELKIMQKREQDFAKRMKKLEII